MKLMGLDRLQQLAEENTADVVGAVGSLLAELRVANWTQPDELVGAYPSARISGQRVEIDLDDDHCVTLLVNYETRCVLIVAAGWCKPTRMKKGK